jgi:hypothetical protein
MKKIIYILVIAAMCNNLSAQNDTLKLSLDQAIQVYSFLIAKINYQKALGNF